MPAAAGRDGAPRQGKGKFWEMHDKLFKNQQALDRAPASRSTPRSSASTSTKFKAALDSKQVQRAASRPTRTRRAKFGARGTPAFFINGRPLSGAQPFDAFKEVIDEEIANARQARCTSRRPKLAGLRRADPERQGQAPRAPRNKPQPQPAQPDRNAVYKVPVGNSPAKGPARRPGHHRRVLATSSARSARASSRPSRDLEKDYGKDCAWSWKNNPLPFHPNAMPGGAGRRWPPREQGKFWEMHDKLFAEPGAPRRGDLEKYAKELGLNMGKFKAALDANKYKAHDQGRPGARRASSARAARRPSSSTAARSRGAQPNEAFKTVIDKEIADGQRGAQARRQAGRPLRRA